MFRVEFLKVSNHPQLGNLELSLSEPEETVKANKPYTSVIIGPNGTGKSYILRTIAEILRQFKTYSTTNEKLINLPFDIHLRYKIYYNTYEIVTISQKSIGRYARKKYLFYKNRPLEKPFYDFEKGTEIITKFEILYSELEFPEKLLVNAVIPTDRFVWQNSTPGDFYQYLGTRSTSSTTSTKSNSRRTVSHIFNATAFDVNFKESLKELLAFLGFDASFKVHYSTKITQLFFSGHLRKEDFITYFENWWDEEFKFTKRKKENPLWSIPYYNKNFKDNQKDTENIIEYLNNISNEEGRLKGKRNSSAKIIEIDLFDEAISQKETEIIRHLENLDIISLESLKIKKAESALSIDQVSSGEYHLLTSLIGIFSNLSNDSLVLIDEPEISLHPNWQMKYITFLKKVFAKYASCHFILSTHSHFLISDLEGDSSSVTALNRDVNNNSIRSHLLKGADTFGWSAEQVLLDIFDVQTTRNYAVAEKLGVLLDFIADEKNNDQDVRNKFFELELDKLKNLNDTDPLKEVYKTIEKEYVLDQLK